MVTLVDCRLIADFCLVWSNWRRADCSFDHWGNSSPSCQTLCFDSELAMHLLTEIVSNVSVRNYHGQDWTRKYLLYFSLFCGESRFCAEVCYIRPVSVLNPCISCLWSIAGQGSSTATSCQVGSLVLCTKKHLCCIFQVVGNAYLRQISRSLIKLISPLLELWTFLNVEEDGADLKYFCTIVCCCVTFVTFCSAPPPPIAAASLHRGVVTMRCDVCTSSYARVTLLVSGAAQTCFDDHVSIRKTFHSWELIVWTNFCPLTQMVINMNWTEVC